MGIPANVDKHPVLKGLYIASDAEGWAFRVCALVKGGWIGAPSHGRAAIDVRRFRGDTLREVAAKIAESKPAF
jgi:hypothetical protein